MKTFIPSQRGKRARLGHVVIHVHDANLSDNIPSIVLSDYRVLDRYTRLPDKVVHERGVKQEPGTWRKAPSEGSSGVTLSMWIMSCRASYFYELTLCIPLRVMDEAGVLIL